MTKTLSDSTLRSRASRQGYTLQRSRAALSCDNQGGYMVIDKNNCIERGTEHYEWKAEDVQKFLEAK